MIKIQVINESGAVLDEAQDDSRAMLQYRTAYAPGDTICVTASGEKHIAIKLDEQVDWAYVYAPQGKFTYKVPSKDERRAYAPKAFTDKTPLIQARLMRPWQVLKRRNLALNPLDQRGDADAYPHATANVETRGESVFAARNVIDGCTTNRGHGDWPYQSWGIGARTDAFLTLDFGREVRVDEMVLYLRADFPHDAYWTSATVVLSDGFEMSFPLERTGNGQTISFGQHDIRWLRLEKLIKSDEPSAFPALSQLMVFGADRMDALNQYWDMDAGDDEPDDAEQADSFPEEWANARLARAYTGLNLPQEFVPLLHDYFDAFAHLYGIVPLRKAFEIIQKQNDGISEEALLAFAEIARHEWDNYYSIMGQEELYEDAEPSAPLDREIIHEYLLIDDDDYGDMKLLQEDKPYYIPSKRTLLKYADDRYFETSPEYYAFRDYLRDVKKLKRANDIANEAHLHAQMHVQDVQYLVGDLARMGLELASEQDARRFLSFYRKMADNVRTPVHRGFTSSEIYRMMPDDAVAIGSDMDEFDIDISGMLTSVQPVKREAPKVGRNDPCPCGSGKKYKQCCGK